MDEDNILLAHGAGGLLSQKLIKETFLPSFRNIYLEQLEDSASFDVQGREFCFSTDTYVVSPLFFPGGDIGSLAVHGTINDLAMSGAKPLYLSAGFIIEEGLSKKMLKRIVRSMGCAAKEANVDIIAGDTKVVAKGSADGLYINTSGLGLKLGNQTISPKNIQPGDSIIINGPIGDHGATILSEREGFSVSGNLKSDSAALNDLVEKILRISSGIHCMRDLTRGGLGGILAELSSQAGWTFNIEERAIPVREEVRAICEIMGLDPLFIANEGKMVLFCHPDCQEQVLKTMGSHRLGQESALIGRVDQDSRGRVILKTLLGSKREIDLPPGEIVPRIC